MKEVTESIYSGLLALLTCLSLCVSCRDSVKRDGHSLLEELYALIDTVPGTVGIAYVSHEDTIIINNGVHYPMMSVFKLHQALGVAQTIEDKGWSLDSTLHIYRDELDLHTWSPMLEVYSTGDFKVSIGELMGYAVTRSDNNASNLLFKHIIAPKEAEHLVKSLSQDTTFRIRYAESELKERPVLSYLNYTSPLSAALLIRQVFEEPLVNQAAQDSIKHYLSIATTGQDRLGSVAQNAGVSMFAHKTGSGYRNDAGELMAHNDVGYFLFEDGQSYSLAVFIRDFAGNEEEASRVIADISKCVYNYFMFRL